MSAVIKILLADDDKEDRDIFEDGLENLGAGGITHYARDGEEALAFLKNCDATEVLPSLIVLDLNMPRINGKETLRAIRKDPRYNSIPVYIYSTSLNPIERDECLLMGASAYLIKPISFGESVAIAKQFRDMVYSHR